MTDAVIVSTARTPIGKAYRGAFNMTHGATLGAHVINHAIQRAGVDPAEIEEVIMGVGRPEGATGGNIARQSALKAGLPVGSTGLVVSRACGSGLQAIAVAAQRIIVDKVPVILAGGMESISLTVNEFANRHMTQDDWLKANKPSVYDTMIQTAETVAKRYNISREAQDHYGVQSQARVVAAQAAGRFDKEIVPLASRKAVTNKETGQTLMQDVLLTQDEGIRATTYEQVSALKPVMEGGCITAGNASQLSDGASACVVMDSKLAEKRGCNLWASSVASRSPVASRTRWALARFTPCRVCLSVPASNSPMSACGNSTKPSPCKSCTAATSLASTMTSSTSTAAVSQWATPSACPVPGWLGMR